MSEWQEKLMTEFLPAILHGDSEHRQWLRDAFEAFIDGREIPKVRPTPPEPQQ